MLRLTQASDTRHSIRLALAWIWSILLSDECDGPRKLKLGAHTHADKHSSSADSLARPCRLPSSYGFPLHHRGVDYNPQKPLIKACFDVQLFICKSQPEPRIHVSDQR